MAVEHHVLDFTPTSAGILTEEDSRNEVFECLRGFGMKGPIVSSDLGEYEGLMFVFTCKTASGRQMILRSFPVGLITLDITYQVKEEKDKLKIQDLEDLHSTLNKTLCCKRTHRLKPPLRRGADIDPYLYTSDDRILEYDFDQLILDVHSPYQHIQIYHSIQYGNCLVLDDLINLCESDVIYTHTLLGFDRHSYKDKTVLVLGAGDGGILHEVLKKDPKFVTMVEIDQMVIDNSKEHLRGICGNSLDSLKGDNYEVMVTDCVPVLKKYIKEGKQFDFVISDLTDVPITNTDKDLAVWSLLVEIMDLGVQVLAPKGRFFTHTIGATCKEAIKTFEKKLQDLSVPVDFSSDTAFVPSFQELWVFHEIWKKSPVCNGS